MTLAKVRDYARKARELTRQRLDPGARQQASGCELRAAVAAAWRFHKCGEACIKSHRADWKNAKHVQPWVNTLAPHAYLLLFDFWAGDDKAPEVLAMLGPIWTTKPETASRLCSRIEQISSSTPGTRSYALQPSLDSTWIRGPLGNKLQSADPP
jgi:hypothetical protein